MRKVTISVVDEAFTQMMQCVFVASDVHGTGRAAITDIVVGKMVKSMLLRSASGKVYSRISREDVRIPTHTPMNLEGADCEDVANIVMDAVTYGRASGGGSFIHAFLDDCHSASIPVLRYQYIEGRLCYGGGFIRVRDGVFCSLKFKTSDTAKENRIRSASAEMVRKLHRGWRLLEG